MFCESVHFHKNKIFDIYYHINKIKNDVKR